MSREVVIHTDGACRGNPGPGGWGAVLAAGERERELCGYEPETTNNRMELMAVIRALEALKRPCDVRIVTDSQYVMKGVTEWMAAWKRRGWRTADRKPVRNVDLWQRLDAALAGDGDGASRGGQPARRYEERRVGEEGMGTIG